MVGTDKADINTLGNTWGLPDSDITVGMDQCDMVRAYKFSFEPILMLRQHTEVVDLPVALATARKEKKKNSKIYRQRL